jgi:NitT/TauT family transport system ATP-binding protein
MNVAVERPLLEVAIKRKAYANADVSVLQDLHFRADRGEVVAVVGPSGAGKSTLLAMIAALDTDYDGVIDCRVQSVTNGAGFTNVSFVFQEPRLVPWLNVRANIELVLAEPNPKRVSELIDSVGLSAFTDYYPNQLSGGMQRRLALIRAFIVDPDILLLDEPFVSLDVPTADQLRGQLMALWETTKPLILFVTHNLDEAIAIADRILFLSKAPGRLIKQVTVDIQRPRRVNSGAVHEFRDRLLTANPQLLAGVVETRRE